MNGGWMKRSPGQLMPSKVVCTLYNIKILPLPDKPHPEY